MTRKDFFELIIKECEIESDDVIREDTKLNELDDWDSLSFITILSLFKAKLDYTLTINQLRECQSFKDLLDIAEARYEK